MPTPLTNNARVRMRVDCMVIGGLYGIDARAHEVGFP
jgi:hypothetical protein